MRASPQVLSESDPEHLLKFHGVCLWDGRLTLVTELMKVCSHLWTATTGLYTACHGARLLISHHRC